MKTLNNYLLIGLAAFACFSCYTPKMQVVSLENEKIKKNDSLWVYHDSLVDFWFYFYARNGADFVFIENKTSKPVFLDLKNSFISVDNFKKDFWTDVSQLDASLTLKQYRAPLSLQTRNPVSGTISRPERIIMIAPNSVDNLKTFVNLHRLMYPTENYAMSSDTVAANWTGKSKKTIIRSVNFDKNTSPSHIRFFFTLAKTEDFKDPMYHDLYFYVSNIQQMDARQATNSAFPSDYSSGAFAYGDKNPDRADKHPYKKSWRFFIAE